MLQEEAGCDAVPVALGGKGEILGDLRSSFVYFSISQLGVDHYSSEKGRKNT